MGLPRSKTWRMQCRPLLRDSVLERGSPMPLSLLPHARTLPGRGNMRPTKFVRLGWGEGFAKIRADAAYNDSPVWFRG